MRFTQPDPSDQETNTYLYAGGDRRCLGRRFRDRNTDRFPPLELWATLDLEGSGRRNAAPNSRRQPESQMNKRQRITFLVFILVFGVLGVGVGALGLSRAWALVAFVVAAVPLLALMFSFSTKEK
jgi:hypothetical protein